MSFTEIGIKEMPCPVCGAQTKRLFSKYDYPIHQCVACQHRYVALQPSCHHGTCTCTDHVFQTGSNDSQIDAPNPLAEADLLQKYGWRYAEILKAYMPPGTLLHVGSATGFMLKGLLERGWYGVGLEPNRRLADDGRAHFGLPMVMGTLENTVVKPGKKAPFDLIMMIQTIGHFQHLHKALSNAAALTRTDGFWLIETRDRTSWPAQLLGRYWQEYKPPTNLHWFSPPGLAKLAERYGFVEVARGRPRQWVSGAQMKAQLEEKLQEIPGQQMLHTSLSLIPDQLKLPKPSFDLFWTLLQKRTKPQLYSIPTRCTTGADRPKTTVNYHSN